MSAVDTLSFQLYSARKLQPLDAQFELLGRLGYRKVEPFGGLFGEPEQLKRLAAVHQMTMPTAHVGLDRFRADAPATFKLVKDLGIETVFIPAPPMGEREGDAQHWARLGAELNELSKQASDAGIGFGWHNHHWEYGRDADGKAFLDHLFDAAPTLLWEADLAWIIRGGADPVSEVARHAKRLVAVHVKDLAPAGEALDEDGWADPGHGTIDWTVLRPAYLAAGAKLQVVEHDNPNDVARFARRAFETVTSWG